MARTRSGWDGRWEWGTRARGSGDAVGAGRYRPHPIALRQNPPRHLPRHVRQPKVPPAVPVRQPLVVDAEEMQDRRVQVVHVNLVLGGVVSVLVRRAVADAALDREFVVAVLDAPSRNDLVASVRLDREAHLHDRVGKLDLVQFIPSRIIEQLTQQF